MNFWQLLSPIWSTIVSALLGYFVARLKQAKTANKAEHEALGALLRNDMFQIYDQFRDAEEVPVRTQEEMESLWQAYHGLGFNHTGDKIHDEIVNKKTKL